MYHLLGYAVQPAGAVVLVQAPQTTDPSFPAQGDGNSIFYEDYELDGVYAGGALLTDAQLSASLWNAINPQKVYPANLSINIPASPQIYDRRAYPIRIPMAMEVQAQVSASAADQDIVLLWISPRGQPRNFPAPMNTSNQPDSIGRLYASATITTALLANAWTPDVPIVIPSTLAPGTYCIAGAYVIVATGQAFRFNFPRSTMYGQRKLYPGLLCTNAYSDIPWRREDWWMGPMGYFDTTQFPQLSIFSATAVASATYQVVLDLIYCGTSLIGQAGMPPAAAGIQASQGMQAYQMAG